MAAQPLAFKVPRRNAAAFRSLALVERHREAGMKRCIDRTDTVLTRYEARATGFDIEIKKLQARKKHALARVAAVEERTLELMTEAGLDKLLGNRAVLTKRANAISLEVDNLDLVPACYVRSKTTTTADKVAIKVALERGEEVAGVSLRQSISLIRTG